MARLIAVQALVGAAAIVLAAVFAGRSGGMAAALGALAALVPQAWFAFLVLRRGVIEGSAATMLRAMYLGEAIKLAAIVLIFVGIFRHWPEVPPVPLLLAFIAVQAVHWFAPLLLEH